MKYIRIPLERVGVLIGPNGDVKKYIEDRSGIELFIDSNQGEVSFNEDETKDPLMVLKTLNIIKAIDVGDKMRIANR